MKTIARDDYLQQLIDRKHNGLVKIVTGGSIQKQSDA